jgi:next to BRCA1 gene 1 protein
VNGLLSDQVVDIAVDFCAPARAGRYHSYWRLASPSGEKFGPRVWVLFQVNILLSMPFCILKIILFG